MHFRQTLPLGSQRANITLADHPVGDPFAGAAYGDLHKSKGLGIVVGVVAGLVTAGAGWGVMAGAGAAGAAAGSTTAMLAGGAMFAGGVSTALGAATGNKKLSKIGGILSLAGGIGTMGADMLAGEALGTTASTGWNKTVSDLTSSFGKTAGMANAAGTGAETTISQGGLTGTGSSGGITGLTQGGGTQGMTGGLLESAMEGGIGQGGSLSLQPAGSAGASPYALGGAGDGLGLKVAGDAASGASAAGAGGTAAGSKGLIGSAMDFMKTPGGMNLAGNMIQGAMGGDDTSIKQKELDLLTEKYKDSRADLERELGNINFRYEVIDPTDPQAEQKRQAAKAQGVPTITLGANRSANVQAPAGVTNMYQQQTQGAY